MGQYLVELDDGRKFEVEADAPPTEADVMGYLGAEQPVGEPETPSEPLFDISDTLAATGQALGGLTTTMPHAYRQLGEGLGNPWKRSPEYLASQQAMKRYNQELEAANKAAQESGDISVLSRGMRGAGQSLGFSAGAMGSSLVGGSAVGTAGRYIGSLAGPEGAAAGEFVGRGIGALGASYGAAYRMAGAQFLDDAREAVDAKFQRLYNRLPTEEEQEEAYQELLPLAEAFGQAEAGPEAIGNLALGFGGKYVLGLGRKKITQLADSALAKVLKKAAAGTAAAATEFGGETVTEVEQNRIDEQARAAIAGEAPPEQPPRSVEEYVKAFGDIAPTTAATMMLLGGAGVVAKGAQRLMTPPTSQPTEESEEPMVLGRTVQQVLDEAAVQAEEAGSPLLAQVIAEQTAATVPEAQAETAEPSVATEPEAAAPQTTEADSALAARIESYRKFLAANPGYTGVEQDLRDALAEQRRRANKVVLGAVPQVQPQVSFESRNKEMLPEKDDFGGKFVNPLNIDPASYSRDGDIETVNYINPETGEVDVFISAFGNNDYIAYMRQYDEQGRPTNSFTSKLERRTNKTGATKKMLQSLQARLPANHRYTEDVSVSTDGLRFFLKQLRQGYLVETENGAPVTTEVAVSGESIQNDLPVSVNPNGKFENIRINNRNDFDKVRAYLGKMLEGFGVGLGEKNVRWENGTAFIDLPVLRKKTEKSPAVNAVTTEEQETLPLLPQEEGQAGESRTPAEGSIPAVTAEKMPDTSEVSSVAPSAEVPSIQEPGLSEGAQRNQELIAQAAATNAGRAPVSANEYIQKAAAAPQSNLPPVTLQEGEAEVQAAPERAVEQNPVAAMAAQAAAKSRGKVKEASAPLARMLQPSPQGAIESPTAPATAEDIADRINTSSLSPATTYPSLVQDIKSLTEGKPARLQEVADALFEQPMQRPTAEKIARRLLDENAAEREVTASRDRRVAREMISEEENQRGGEAPVSDDKAPLEKGGFVAWQDENGAMQEGVLTKISAGRNGQGEPMSEVTLETSEVVQVPRRELRPMASMRPDSRDVEYMAAVEAGDMEKAQRMVDEAAKAAGYNVGPVWHGTVHEGLTEFYGGWWSDRKQVTREFGDVRYAAYLSGNLADGDKLRELLREYEGSDIDPETEEPYYDSEIADMAMAGSGFQDFLKSKGVQGIGVWDESNRLPGMAYAVFSPEQIKSADPVTRDESGDVIPLSQRFQTTSPDIRFSKKPTNPVRNARAAAIKSLRGHLGEEVSVGVSAVDGINAMTSLQGAVPGVQKAWIGTREDFLADESLGRAFPGIRRELESPRGEQLEGLFDGGRAFVFTNNVGVYEGDVRVAKEQSELTGEEITPQQAAVQRVITHEGLVHRGFYALDKDTRRALFQWGAQNIYEAEMDAMAEEYGYADDWRTNERSREWIMEEILAKKIERLKAPPKSGPLKALWDILVSLWRKLTGSVQEVTLKDIQDVAKVLRTALELSENNVETRNGMPIRVEVAKGSLRPRFTSPLDATLSDTAKALRLMRDGPPATPVDLQQAYATAVRGKSSAMVSLDDLFAAAKASSPSLTEAEFGRQVQNLYNDNGAYVESAESPAVMKQSADRYNVRSSQGIPASYVMILETGRPMASMRADSRDAEYLAAVEAGDMETAQRMVDEAARAAGYNVGPVWHGSPEEDFTEFQKPEKGSDEDGFWFSKDREWASKFGPTRLFYIKNAKTWGGDDFVTKESSDIKSADPVTYDDAGNVIPLSQRFQTTSPDIRFSLRPDAARRLSRAVWEAQEASGPIKDSEQTPLKDYPVHSFAQQSGKSRTDVAIQVVDELLKSGVPVNGLVDAINSYELHRQLGIERDPDMLGILLAEAMRRGDPNAFKAYQVARERAGRALGTGAILHKDPRFQHLFLLEGMKDEQVQQARDIQNANAPMTADEVKRLDAEAGRTAAAEIAGSVEDGVFQAGEEALSKENRTLWERIKNIVSRLGVIAGIKVRRTQAKPSIRGFVSEAERQELESMSPEQLDAEEARLQAEFRAVAREFLGVEASEAELEKLRTTAERRQQKKRTEVFSGNDSKVLRHLIEQARKRSGDKTPLLPDSATWTKIFSGSPQSQEAKAREMLDYMKADPLLSNLTAAEQQQLADMFARRWEQKRKELLEAKVASILKARNATPKGKNAAKDAVPRFIQAINRGELTNDVIAEEIAEKFGFEKLTEGEKKTLERLSRELQEPNLPQHEKTAKIDEMAKIIAKKTRMSMAEILSAWWVTSVLSGPRTAFTIGLAASNGAFEVLGHAVSTVLNANWNGRRAEGLAAAGQAFTNYVKSWPRAIQLAWQYVLTGDKKLLSAMDPTYSQFFETGRNNPLSVGWRLSQSKNPVARATGRFMHFFEKLLSALDLFTATTTRHGMLPISYYLNQKVYDKARVASETDLANYRKKVIDLWWGGKEPTTGAEQALVTRQSINLMEEQLAKYANVLEDAGFAAAQAAMTLTPEGLGGQFYQAVRSVANKAERSAEKAVREAERLDGKDHGPIERNTRKAQAYLYRFLAYQMLNVAGLRFARFAGNKLNQSLGFIPGLGLLRKFEKDYAGPMKNQAIMRNQAIGAMMAMVGYNVLKAIGDEPDDDKRGWGIEGSWKNLTPDQIKQLQAAGRKQYTIHIGDQSYNYANWPVSSVLAAIGTMADRIKYSPDKWKETSALDKIATGAWAASTATMDASSLSQLAEVFGSNIHTRDPVEASAKWASRVFGNYAGGMIPRVFKDADLILDGKMGKYDGWENFGKEIPVYRRYVGGPLLDIFGKQVEVSRTPWSREFQVQPPEREYRLLGQLNSNDLWLTPANPGGRRVGRGKRSREMTDAEQKRYVTLVGDGYRKVVLKFGDRLAKMDHEGAKDLLGKLTAQVRDRAERQAVTQQ